MKKKRILCLMMAIVMMFSVFSVVNANDAEILTITPLEQGDKIDSMETEEQYTQSPQEETDDEFLFSIAIKDEQGGIVSADKNGDIAEGEEVTITALPESTDFALYDVVVMCGGERIFGYFDGEYDYIFYMPSGDVTVEAVFIPSLVIGGVVLKNGEYLANGESEPSHTAPETGGYVYYKDGILTLHNYEYTGSGYTYDEAEMSETIIYSANPVTIVLEGNNHIVNTQSEGGESGICAKELTVEGEGSLTVDASEPIYVYDNIFINSGKIFVNTNSYYGIRSSYNLEISGGSVEINGGVVGLASDYGKVVIESGAVLIDVSEYAIYSYDNIELYEEKVFLPIDFTEAWAGAYVLIDANTEESITDIVFADVECEWSEEWEKNLDYHWHPCTDDECIINRYPKLCNGYSEHNTDEICVCGADMKRDAKVYIGKFGIAEGEYLDNSGNLHTDMPDGGYAHYEDGVLTLDNFEFSGKSYTPVICDSGSPSIPEDDFEVDAALCATENIELVLFGENSISNTELGDAIYSGYDVTVKGDGRLEIISEDDAIDIWGEFIILSGEIDIKKSDDVGITVKKDIYIEGGKLDINASDDGILGRGDIYISGGEINIETEEKGIMTMPYYDYDYNMVAEGGDIYISGGNIYISADDEAIYTDEIYETDNDAVVGDIIISGGDLTLYSNEDCINANEKIDYDGNYISGGSIFISGGNLELYGCESGLEAEKDIEITGGKIEIEADLNEEEHPALNVLGEIYLGENVEIYTPVNGSISKAVYNLYSNEIMTIVDEYGEIATDVVFKVKKSSGGNRGGSSGSSSGSGIGGGLLSGAFIEYTPYTPYVPPVTVTSEKSFSDVSNHWAKEDVDFVCKNNLMKGISEDIFAPDSQVTRAMLITVLYRYEGEPAINRSIPFADVDMNAYYSDAVVWGQQNGIINGYSETEFAPNDNITREQLAAIVYRYAVYKGLNAVTMEENLHYNDSHMISEYAVSAMNWAVGGGLMNGKSETEIKPFDFATRAEIAAIVHRFAEMNK